VLLLLAIESLFRVLFPRFLEVNNFIYRSLFSALMTVAEDILKKSKKKKLHFSLLDPDKQKPEVAGSIAKTAEESGSSAIMVGGSTLISQKQVDETVKAIKDHSSLPVILFPNY